MINMFIFKEVSFDFPFEQEALVGSNTQRKSHNKDGGAMGSF